MVVTSIIKLSEFEGAKRIDAEYYQPFFSSLENDLKNIGYDSLKRYSEKVFSGPFGSTLKSESYQKCGIPFIRIGNIVDIFISERSLVCISEKEHKRILSTHLNPGDIVFSKIGTIGRLSVISEDLGQVNISENNIGIRFRQLPTYERIFILFFLLSRYGQTQIVRRASGNVQPKLNVKDIESIKIPRIGDETKIELAEKHKQMYALYNRSALLYSQAENLLLEELGLKDFDPKYELSYTVNLSKPFAVHRIDAEYFQPAYDEVIKKILEYQNGYTNLLSCVENVKPHFDPTKYPDRTFSYVELADIDASIGAIHSTSKIKGEEAPSRARRFLREDDLIVSSVEGSLEKVALVSHRFEGALASTGFFQFRPLKIVPEVLLVLSKSIILQIQLKRECAGTILTAVSNDSLRRILIPVLPEGTRRKVASCVQQSHEARSKAKKLLEEAKRKVEEIIEYGIEK